MNELKIFENPEFGQVRTVMVGDKPYFVGKDIASALGYARATKAIQDNVDDDDKDVVLIQDSIGRHQNTPIINESGLYSLILSSKLPNAKQFKRWVTSDVLPTIRKHGVYATDETLEKMLQSPEFGIRVFTQLKQEREENKRLTDVVRGCNCELSVPEMRQVLNRIVCKNGQYGKRWTELYKQFNMKFHTNIQQCARNRGMANLDYVQSIGMLSELYDIACKLYESEMDSLVKELYYIA